MYRKILVGHDLQPGGDGAVALGRELARTTGADLVVANVFAIGALPYGFEAGWAEEEDRAARAIQQIAHDAGAEAQAFPASSPTAGLYRVAEQTDAVS